MLNDYGKELFKPWCSVQNVVVALSVIFLMALGIIHFSLNSSEVASWVQAIGSIAAIWGAFTVSNSQVKRQIEQKKEDDRRKAGAYYAVVKSAADHTRSLGQVVSKEMPPALFTLSWDIALSSLIETSLTSLKQLPAHEFGNYELVIFHNGMTGALIKAFESAKRLTEASITEEEADRFYTEMGVQCSFVEHYWECFKKASLQ